MVNKSIDTWTDKDRADYECWLATVEPQQVPRWVNWLTISVRVIIVAVAMGAVVATLAVMGWITWKLGGL